MKPLGKRSAVRYAVIGLGHIAQAAILPAFRHAGSNSILTALVSGNRQKLKALGRRYGVTTLCDYAHVNVLFDSGKVDAVYIALPNHLHKEFTLRAAGSGLHVLCEKPMAVTTRDCDRMIQATNRARVKLMIAYRLHFERANLQAATLARQNRLGELRYFSSDFSMQVSKHNIRLKRAKGGGPLHDIGVYCINAARYALSDSPVAVWATATRSADRRFREVDESVIGVMRFKNERVASFTCSFGAADRSTFTITGTRGTVKLDPAYEYAQGLAYKAKIGDRRVSRQFAKSDQFAPELIYFSDCILHDRKPEPSGEEGRADIAIIEAMMKSISSGRWMKIPTHRTRQQAPSLRQAMRIEAVPREPPLLHVTPASQ